MGNEKFQAVRAFIPPPPPPFPPVRLERLQHVLEQANQAVGRLDGIASVLPDVSLLIYTYVRKEAVLSSPIGGTQSSLSDLLMFENDEIPGAPKRPARASADHLLPLCERGDPGTDSVPGSVFKGQSRAYYGLLDRVRPLARKMPQHSLRAPRCWGHYIDARPCSDSISH